MRTANLRRRAGRAQARKPRYVDGMHMSSPRVEGFATPASVGFVVSRVKRVPSFSGMECQTVPAFPIHHSALLRRRTRPVLRQRISNPTVHVFWCTRQGSRFFIRHTLPVSSFPKSGDRFFIH